MSEDDVRSASWLPRFCSRRAFTGFAVGEGGSSERVGTKKDILSVVKVSDETLRIRLAEFESTAASFFICRVSRVGSLTIEEFNKLADQTNDFAVDERGEAVGDDGIMSSHPPAFVRNRLKDETDLLMSMGDGSQQDIGGGGGRV